MVVKRMVALTPGSDTLLLSISDQVRLALDTWLHKMVSANGTVFDLNIPQPKRHRRPLLHLEALLRVRRLLVNLF